MGWQLSEFEFQNLLLPRDLCLRGRGSSHSAFWCSTVFTLLSFILYPASLLLRHYHSIMSRFAPFLPLFLFYSVTNAFVPPSSTFTRARRDTSLYYESEETPEPEKAILDLIQGSSSISSSIHLDEAFVAFPHTVYTASDVVHLCMDTLQTNNEIYANAGLEVCWNFSSDRCRASQGGSLDNFIAFAGNPVLSSMICSHEWKMVSTGNLIAGTKTRGAMQTFLVDVTKGDRTRRFLWTLQQERRPPRQGCWLVHECIDTQQAYQLTL